MARLGFIEFYYSTKHKPVDKYKCDNANVLNLLKSLEAKGVETLAIDLADVADPFKQYHKASSGPILISAPFSARFGVRIIKNISARPSRPCAAMSRKATGPRWRFFPRGDKKLGREYLIEEFLENYIGELEGRIEAPEAN